MSKIVIEIETTGDVDMAIEAVQALIEDGMTSGYTDSENYWELSIVS